MAGFGFSISDLIQVSNLAIQLYRRCRDSPNEFVTLASEVANLRTLIDDVRLTVRERHLTEEQTEQILGLGQGCLNCLLDLEALLQKHQNLGNKAKRTFDRLKWDKGEVSLLRQTLISNISLLNAFNTSLTRSATARIEDLLRGFLQDYKLGRHEGSVLSVDTIRSIQKGDDNIWKDIQKDFEAAGITQEQLNEHRKLITDTLVKAIQSGGIEQNSTIAASFHTATDGGSNRYSGSTVLSGTNLPPALDFPGTEFQWCKDLVNSVNELYRDAPEQYSALQAQLSETRRIIIEIGRVKHDVKSLSYHEHLTRKPAMLPTLDTMTEILKGLQKLEGLMKTGVKDSVTEFEWAFEGEQMNQVDKLRRGLELSSLDLKSLFSNIDTMLLCNLEDNIRIIINEMKEKQRSTSVLSSWDELEAELVEIQDISEDDVRDHQKAILSFLRLETEEFFTIDVDGNMRLRSGSVGNASTLMLASDLSVADEQPPDIGHVQPRKSHSSITESDSIPLPRLAEVPKPRPKRVSVLFVDLNNTVRSPMAQAYLEYLVALHPVLATSFSRILSAGIAASKPGVPLSAGVEFMLRDYGISSKFSHISRRLERRDVEKFEYVLTMSCSQRDTILSRWTPRSNLPVSESGNPGEVCREDLQDKVAVLGSFGGHGDREVSIAESINQVYWFHVGTKRIYPGYDKCFNEIKAYMTDFIYELTGIDVHSQAVSITQEVSSRNASHDISEDEEFSDKFPSPSWSIHEDRSGFEALRREISRYQESSATHDHEHFPDSQSPIQVRIRADQQPLETDEEVLHKHHEQFDRLMTLLLTDIGDNSFSSLRQMVLDWERDNNRSILAVNTGACQWVLEKSTIDPAEACHLCTKSGKKSGFVRDAQLEVITVEEADVIAQYLSIAIKESMQDSGPSDEQARALESIRDSNRPNSAAAPSIRDDVSVSVRNDKPQLEHQVAKIRQRDAQNKLSQAEKQRVPTFQMDSQQPSTPSKLVRRKTAESEIQFVTSKLALYQRKTDASQATATPHFADQVLKSPAAGRASPAKEPSGTQTPAETTKKPLDPVVPVSILFLGSSHLHGAIMAEVYLISCVGKSLPLACQICDVVSAGVRKITSDQKLNPKKLERLFKNHDIFNCWPQKPERILLPEDSVDFNYILSLDTVDPDVPYHCWAEDNPDEARDMKEIAAAKGSDWRSNFKSKIDVLGRFDMAERRNQPLLDPVQPSGVRGKFGVPMIEFEKHFQRIKYAIDQFLSRELGFDVEKNRFTKVKDEAAVNHPERLQG